MPGPGSLPPAWPSTRAAAAWRRFVPSAVSAGRPSFPPAAACPAAAAVSSPYSADSCAIAYNKGAYPWRSWNLQEKHIRFLFTRIAYNQTLKVPKCEIFDPFFLTPINPIWVGDLRTGEKKKKFRRLRQIFAILFFLRRLSLR